MTNEELISNIISHTKSGKSRQFQYLRNYREYCIARKIYRAEKVVLASINAGTNKIFKNYCKAIKSGEAAVEQPFAYRFSKDALAFYEKDLNTISDMIIEYECYLINGNILDFVLGLQRPVDKLWDHRKL